MSEPGEEQKAATPEQGEALKPADILYVEDEANLATMFKVVMRGTDYSVDHAPDLASALNYLKTRRPGLVITDMSLTPDGTEGWTVAEAAKSTYPDMPVAILSSQAGRLTEDPRASTVDKILSKPYSPKELVEEIKDLVLPAAR